MSTSGPPENAYMVSTWPQQIDLSPEDYRAIMESLLKDIKPVSDGKVSIRQRIKERFWLADALRKQGEYDQAMEHYSFLLKLVYDEVTSELSETEIWCLSKAFIDYVDCGRFSPMLPLLEQPQQTAANGMTAPVNTPRRLAHLSETAAKGMAWLEKNDRPTWTAGLQLEHALLLKSQGRLEEALCEMQKAHQKREVAKEAPGYSLFTHKLELAELLYTTAIGEKDDKLVEAANQVSAIPLASESTLKERMLASLMLAKIRQKQGEENTAHVELGKAQKFAYEMEQAAVAEHSHQVLDSAYQDAKKLAEVLAELDQKLQTVKDKAERLESISVHPATDAPIVLTSGSQEAISTRHISCYVSLPHYENEDNFYHQVLLPALRQILECHPFYWQVGYRGDKLVYRQPKCSDCPVGNETGKDNRDCWLKCADLYIADIEGWSQDVVADLGIIYAIRMMMKKETHLPIILKPEYTQPDQQEKLASVKQFAAYGLYDFGKTFFIPHDFMIYPGTSKEKSIEIFIDGVKSRLRDIFFDRGFHELNKKPHEHYLSSLWIKEKCKYDDEKMTRVISRTYITMEAFKDAVKGPTANDTAKKTQAAAADLSSWKVTQGVIESILKEVITVLEGDRT